MYIVVRTDLTIPQQAVQASHAALEASRDNHIPKDLHLILCAAKDEKALFKAFHRLSRSNIHFHLFYEPDFGNELTAIASDVVYDRRPFKHLKLLRG